MNISHCYNCLSSNHSFGPMYYYIVLLLWSVWLTSRSFLATTKKLLPTNFVNPKWTWFQGKVGVVEDFHVHFACDYIMDYIWPYQASYAYEYCPLPGKRPHIEIQGASVAASIYRISLKSHCGEVLFQGPVWCGNNSRVSSIEINMQVHTQLQ